MSGKCLVHRVDDFEIVIVCDLGESAFLRMSDEKKMIGIVGVCEEDKGGACGEVEEEGMGGNHLTCVVDLSMDDDLDRFGPNCVRMVDEEIKAFLASYRWSPLKTNWEDPDVGETVVGTELVDWVYDYRRLDSEGDWVKMVPSSRKKVPEPGSREAFDSLLRRCEESGWTTFSAAGCLMIRFRDLRSMWREGSEWIRNEDPRVGLVLCDGR